MRGFLLAAGLGTRLRPITNTIPKAMVILGKQHLLAYGVDILRRAGIETIGVNAHHHRHFISAYAASQGLSVFEEPEILGTGGYLSNIGDFADQGLVVVNCDALFFEDETFVSRLIEAHLNRENLITLGLMKQPAMFSGTSISFEDHQVKALGEGPLFFTGLQVVSKELVPLVKEKSIVPTYYRLAAEGRLGGELFDGTWFDCGTRQGLIEANQFVFGRSSVVYPEAEVGENVHMKNTVVYNDAVVGAGAVLSDSIIYSGCVEAGAVVKGRIVV